MLQGESGLVGPLLHRGKPERSRQNGQNSREILVPDRPHPIPQRIFPQIRVGNPAIPDVEPLQDLQNADAADGIPALHGDDRAPVEVGDTPQHLVIEQGGDDLIASAHRGRNTKVGKAQEEGLDKGSAKVPSRGAAPRSRKWTELLSPHCLGDGEGLFVHKSHGIVDEQKGYGNGV